MKHAAVCFNPDNYDLIGRIFGIIIVVGIIWWLRAIAVEAVEAMPKKPRWLKTLGYFDVLIQVLVVLAVVARTLTEGSEFTICRVP